MKKNFNYFLILFIVFLTQTNAMTCVDQRFPHPMGIFKINEVTGYSFQVANPMNNAISSRDPTGQFYIRIPAQQPQVEAYFADWNGRLILLNIYQASPMVIGYCSSIMNMPQPYSFQPVLLTPSNYHVIGVPNNRGRLPEQFSPQMELLTKVAYLDPNTLISCQKQSKGENDKFLNCAIENMFSEKELKVFNCTQNAQSQQEQASCIASQFLGDKEKVIFDQVNKCYQANNQLNSLPLCMANQNFDPNTLRSINCVKEQYKGSTQVSPWSLMACVGGKAFKLNAEATVAVQCATTTGGNPYAWVACTGGQLTATELQKCFTNGIGGKSGCFGENNTIIQWLKQIGVDTSDMLGPNNDLVRTYNNAVNDLTHGPGKNNDVVKAVNEIGKALDPISEAGKNISDNISKVFSGITGF